MLHSLSIQNLATIEEIQIEFSAGLNALTGETGAGKSILIGGLELALGERASADAIRPGARLAVVEAVFKNVDSPALRNLIGHELELEYIAQEPLTIRRELSAGGRNRCFINGQFVGVAELKRLGELLVDLHGQHEHQSLFRTDAARLALDAYAAHDPLIEKYETAWREAERLRRRRRELEEAARDFARQVDYLDFQLQEFEQLQPRAGEMAELEAEERRLAHAETLARAAAEAYALLYEGQGDEAPSLLAQLREVQRRLSELTQYETEFAEAPARLEDQKTAFEDLALTLRDYAERTQANPERLNQVISRLESLRRLMRKHGGNEEALLAAWEKISAERARLAHDDAERQTIEAGLLRAETTLKSAGETLHVSRLKAAEQFGKKVAALLRELMMDKARFEVAVEPLGAPAAHGLDAIEFLLAANPGLPAAPLRRVGSGGELSRVMLAIKSVLAARDAIATLVFDEIDAGISGETARRVGRLLEKLSATHQVLCITHHAAIAARAEAHASVRKAARRGQTYTEIDPLSGDGRLEELARMMGGELAAPAARELARQLMA